MNNSRSCEARHGFVEPLPCFAKGKAAPRPAARNGEAVSRSAARTGTVKRARNFRGGTLLAMILPLLAVVGCSSAESGHAPGVAGGQTLTPGITNYPLAYIKQPVLPATATKTLPADIDVRDLITSITGSDLYVRAQASAGGKETNVTSSLTGGNGAVRDLDVSPDGTKLVFSLRMPLNPALKNTDPKQPTWKIYQYDASTATVTQLTNDDITAGHDVGARYLPDGRIVFASTRQLATQSILLNEGRPQYQAVTDNRQQFIFLLHVMNGDGTGMHQITFNTNHDFAPSVLANGQIVFSRWEVTNGTDQISLYVTNPDGTGLELYYGANSHATGANIAGTNNNVIQFLKARQRNDGKLIAIARPFLGTQLGGDALLIDAANYVEYDQTIAPSTGGTAVVSAAAGQTSATTLGVTTDANLPSLGGRFASAYPLYDGTNRMLVSWAPCLVVNSDSTTSICNNANTSGTNVVQAAPPYTVWIYDFGAGTLGPVLSAETGVEVVEPVIMQARAPAPSFIPDAVPSTTPAADHGHQWCRLTRHQQRLRLRRGGHGSPESRLGGQSSARRRFITARRASSASRRRWKSPTRPSAKSTPRRSDPANMGMREILGYAPVQPDGSVQIQVPADVPFTIDVLDQNARRITAQHTSWMQLIPGETKSCNGCHSAANGVSHGRAGLSVAVNTGAPTTGQPFPNTNTALFANAGETMAQTLARISCAMGSTIPCSQIMRHRRAVYVPDQHHAISRPGMDHRQSHCRPETSTHPSPIRMPLCKSTPGEPPMPNVGDCAPWSAQCRITIHYANAVGAHAGFSAEHLEPRAAHRDHRRPWRTAPPVCHCHNTVSAAEHHPGTDRPARSDRWLRHRRYHGRDLV